MSSNRITLLIAVSLLLAGCGEGGSEEDRRAGTAPTTRSVKIRNEPQEKLLALKASDRDLTLRRAVRDGGGSCPKISGSRYQGEFKNMAMWLAHCTSGDWAVFVAPSGNVQARSCKDIPTLNSENPNLNLPHCKLAAIDTGAPVDKPQWQDLDAGPNG